MEFLVALSLFLVLLYFLKRYFGAVEYNPKDSGLKTLPGPFCFPIIGHVQIFFQKDPYVYLSKLSEKYGEIYQIQIGVKTVIVLNSLNAIREAYNEWSFTGRPQFPSFDALQSSNGHKRFAFITYGPDWKLLRRNAVKALSLFASSKNSRLQKVVEAATDSLHMDIMNHINKPFKPKASIGECVAGIIGAINFGMQFDRKDPLIAKLVDLTDVVGRFIQLGTVLDFIPFGSYFMQYKVNEFNKSFAILNTITETHINSHKYNEDVTDVADALHKKRLETTEEELKAANVRSESLQMISQDLFAAGFATTMESFLWSLTLMAKYPEVQEKVAEELKIQIPEDVHPTVNDEKMTPYTEATLLEIFRFISLVPLNLPHATTEPTTYNGYYIPKDAIVYSSLWDIHHNPSVFKNPFEFNPRRFLYDDGSLNSDMAQGIAPFSVGKRRCVGENLARQELYMLFSATIKKFVVRPAPGVQIDVENTDPGFTRRVKQFDLVFSLRK